MLSFAILALFHCGPAVTHGVAAEVPSHQPWPDFSSGNLLQNWDFKNQLNGWYGYFNGADWIKDGDGTPHVQMKCGGDGIHGIYQEIDVDVAGPVTLELSGYTRNHGDVSMGADFPFYYGCRLDCTLKDDTRFAEMDIQIKPMKTGSWQRFDKEFQIPASLKKIRFYVLLWNMKGTVDFAHLKLRIKTPEPVYLVSVRDLFGDGSLETRAYLHEADRLQLAAERTEAAEITRIEKTWPGSFSLPADSRPLREVVLSARDISGKTVYQNNGILGESKAASGVSRSPGAEPAAVFWLQNPMRRVFPVSLPVEHDPPDVHAADLIAAKGEYESFQVAMLCHPKREKLVIRPVLEPLRSDGGTPLGDGSLKWYQVACVRVSRQLLQPRVPEQTPEWQPDPLLEPKEIVLTPGWTQSLWITCFVPDDAAAGDYSGAVRLEDEEGNVLHRQPVKVRVLPMALPKMPSFRTAFANFSRFGGNAYFRTLYPGADFEQLEKHQNRFFINYRLSPTFSFGETPVADYHEDVLPWLDRNHVICLGDVTKHATGKLDKPPSADELSAFRQKLNDEIRPLYEKCRSADLLGRAMIYGFDELHRPHDAVQEYIKVAKETFPGVPFMSTLRCPLDPGTIKRIGVDQIVVFWPRCRREILKPIRDGGIETWAYLMAGDPDQYPQFNMHSPLMESRTVFWQCWNEELGGLLYWGLNIWSGTSLNNADSSIKNDTPIRDTDGPMVKWLINNNVSERLNGDGRLSYPGPDGRPIASIRLMNIRDGLEDYEYIKQCAERIGVEKTRELIREVTTDIDVFTHDADVVKKTRRKLMAVPQDGHDSP
jgi:hypothetical protein